MAKRVALLRQVADLISERVFEIGAVLSIEVGKTGWKHWETWKNRLISSGTAATHSKNIKAFSQDEQPSDNVHNRSVLKPFGVWGHFTIHFPAALSAGPCGAALVAGNTVVHKPAEDSPPVG